MPPDGTLGMGAYCGNSLCVEVGIVTPHFKDLVALNKFLCLLVCIRSTKKLNFYITLQTLNRGKFNFIRSSQIGAL